MEKKFRASLKYGDDYSFLKVAGVIDEDNTLQDITKKLQGKYLIINLAEVERINSCGVRDWVNWLNSLEKAGKRVVMTECSPAIISQVNLVNNFTGNGIILSFYAPYYCHECDLEKTKLLEIAEFQPGVRPKAPAYHCEECENLMEFDDIEESYFAFINGSSRWQVSDEILMLVQEGSQKMLTPTSNILSRTQSKSIYGAPDTPLSAPDLHLGNRDKTEEIQVRKAADVEKYVNILLYLILGGVVVLIILIVYFIVHTE